MKKVNTVKKSTEGTDILKALNARFASLIAKKHRMIQEVQEFKNKVSTNPLKHELVEKTAFSHAHEAPPVRAERVSTPVTRHAPATSFDSCGTCGYGMAKSQEACPICTVAANIQEAKPRGV